MLICKLFCIHLMKNKIYKRVAQCFRRLHVRVLLCLNYFFLQRILNLCSTNKTCHSNRLKYPKALFTNIYLLHKILTFTNHCKGNAYSANKRLKRNTFFCHTQQFIQASKAQYPLTKSYFFGLMIIFFCMSTSLNLLKYLTL